MTIQRWAMIEARTTCTRCGSPAPLAGPSRNPLCQACTSPISISPSTWKSLLEDIDEDWAEVEPGSGQTSKIFTGGGEFSRDWYNLAPRCMKCKTAFPPEAIDAGADGTVHCPSCGAPSQTYPAPDWMREVFPSAVQIVGGEREGGAGGGQAAEVDRDAPQPIVMSCPQCGGALKITVEAKRVTQCTFCNTDVYLPDDIWKRMHPVKTVAPWWVGLAGAGGKKEEEEPEETEPDESDSSDEVPSVVVHEHHGSSGWFYWLIAILAVLSGVGYGGWNYVASSLGFGSIGGSASASSSTSHVAGQFQASGPLLGSWVLQPTTCTGGGMLGPSGAKLSGDGNFVLVVPEATGLHVIAGNGGGAMVDFAGCTGVQGQVQSGMSPTGIQGFLGSVNVQCSDAAGNSISGSATFDGCN